MDYERAYLRLRDTNELKSERQIEGLSTELANTLLVIEQAPDAHVEFLCKLISDEALINRPGMAYLLVEMYTDRDKFSSEQLIQLLECASNNFGLVASEDVAFALGDMIARAAPSEDAVRLLSAMTSNARTRQSLAGVFLGIDILRRTQEECDAPQIVLDELEKNACSKIEILDKEKL